MLAELLAVHPDGRFVVDRAEVQQHALALLHSFGTSNVRRYQLLSWCLPTPRQRRLHRRTARGSARQILADRRVLHLVGRRELPQAVEVLPLLADHLRARVFGVDVVGRDVLRPPRHQRRTSPASSFQHRIPFGTDTESPSPGRKSSRGFSSSNRGRQNPRNVRHTQATHGGPTISRRRYRPSH